MFVRRAHSPCSGGTLRLLLFVERGLLVIALQTIPEVGDAFSKSTAELRELTRAEENDDDDYNFVDKDDVMN